MDHLGGHDTAVRQLAHRLFPPGRPDADSFVGVDGGVNLSTIDRVYEMGVDVTIVGSGLYKANNIKKRFNKLMAI